MTECLCLPWPTSRNVYPYIRICAEYCFFADLYTCFAYVCDQMHRGTCIKPRHACHGWVAMSSSTVLYMQCNGDGG